MRAPLLLVVLCGCDALVGIHEIDAPQAVTGTLVHRFLNLDAAGAPHLETVAFADTDQPLTAFHENGSPIALQWTAATGTFSFTAFLGETYRVLADVGTLPTEYQASSAQLSLVVTDLGHPDETPVDPAAEIDFEVQMPLTGALLATTSGIWEAGTAFLPSGTTTLPQPMTELTPAYRQTLALPRAAANDRVHLLVYSGPNLLGVGTASVDIAAGAPTAVPITIEPTPQPDCAILALHHRNDIDRLARVYPEFPDASSAVAIDSLPDPDLGLVAAMSLTALDPSCVTNPGDCNENPTLQYSIPTAFAAFPIVAVSSIARARIADGVPLAAFIHHYNLMTPAEVCGPTTVDPDDAALPFAPRLAHVALTTDHTVIGIDPAEPVELTFSLDADVPGTSFHFLLERIDSGQATIVREYNATTPRLLLDPALFEEGVSYIIQITAFSGAPGASDGDFGTLQYPYSLAALQTPVFSVSR